MGALSLRVRVFLFFALLAAGALAVTAAAVMLGYRQLDDTAAFSAFLTVGLVAGFGILGLCALIWLLFDENLAKPIERLASGMRVGAQAGGARALPVDLARHLGDLAPAAAAMQTKLKAEHESAEEQVAARTAELEMRQAQLLSILSDIPVAVIVARADHQIVLYDGQAADLMERECPARLGGSVFDYLDRVSVCAHLDEMKAAGTLRHKITVTGRSGTVFKGQLRLFDAGEGYTLMLEPLDPDAARPLVYDFALLEKPPQRDLAETPLRDLCFVVFDSETTGLDPQRDAVVQLGAVRIVNGRIVEGERFDMLVNPGRKIPPAATRVHRIDDAMVASAAPFRDVCRAFHRFAEGAVLVAHNAPFDMAFLRRAAVDCGVDFAHPVLDTVHLSAVVFGASEDHTLDALCERLGVDIPQPSRHTALGDALATARSLVAMLPILDARGFGSFDALRQEMLRHRRILKLEG